MSIRKFAVASLGKSAPLLSKTAGTQVDTLSGMEFKRRPEMLYVAVRAISARVNQNYDAFPSSELKKSYSTFVGRPVFVNHHNEDPTRTRGKIVASKFNKRGNDQFVSLVIEVDAKNFPKLAKEIMDGKIDSVSMGTDVQRTVCSYCGNEATTFFDFCEHVISMKGQTLPRNQSGRKESVLVYETCYGLNFFEISFVFDPADETAIAGDILAPEGYVAKQKVGFGEPRVPEEVDTLRNDEPCPMCGSELDGDSCPLCGYEVPPEGFDEPDLTQHVREAPEDIVIPEQEKENPSGSTQKALEEVQRGKAMAQKKLAQRIATARKRLAESEEKPNVSSPDPMPDTEQDTHNQDVDTTEVVDDSTVDNQNVDDEPETKTAGWAESEINWEQDGDQWYGATTDESYIFTITETDEGGYEGDYTSPNLGLNGTFDANSLEEAQDRAQDIARFSKKGTDRTARNHSRRARSLHKRQARRAERSQRESRMNRRRARRRVASIPNWAVDGSGQVLTPGITYTADVDGEVMAFQATDQGLSVLTGMQPGLVSWDELEGAWDSFKPQKVSTRTSSFEVGDKVLYMGDSIYPEGKPGEITKVNADGTYKVITQRPGQQGTGSAIATEDQLQSRTSRRRQISSFKIGDEVYINAPISAYSDVDDQYGTIVSGDENEFQVKTEDGEIVDITPEYLEMHIESKRKASRRRTSAVPDWAVDENGNKLEVGQKYYESDVDWPEDAEEVTEDGLIRGPLSGAGQGTVAPWVDLKDPMGDGSIGWPTTMRKVTNRRARRVALGRARIRSRRQAQRRQSALTWSEVPGLAGSWEADENGIYFSYSAPYKELDWWDGTTDFYYDGNPSLEEAKQIAERVISGEEAGSTL